MQTQCPYCDTQFRVTSNQVKIANGFVRCGVCRKVFNLKQSAQNKNKKKISLIEDNDFFDENKNQSLNHVVPDGIRRSRSIRARLNNQSNLSQIFTGIFVVVLAFSLLIEYAWFNRTELKVAPQLLGALEAVCPQSLCQHLKIHIPEKIEMVTRNIFSHPNADNALMVTMTLRNNANFTQPYPIMQLKFSDQRGSVIASRQFTADEYISDEVLQANMKPLESVNISLEIKDPGVNNMTYEFNFL